MNHQPIYKTNGTLSSSFSSSIDPSLPKGVIRPPIRAAYFSEREYMEAKTIGMMYAEKHGIEYNHY